ncbi:hypothetical protein L7F22_056769 [Adiantum nelumboides]|nr:hypothetical protein [Adiantum nelumboides]
MPPRKTRAAAAAAAASAEEAPGKGTNGVADADGKKREAGQLEEEDGPAAKRSRIDEEAAPQPPVPGNSEVPLPPEDEINRSLLDFDFEKLCSVSLSNINIYACLVCGKYYQGRGPNSFAYYHAINDGHRVFMNLESSDVYVLPDNYKVNDPSLSDIKFLLLPTYADQQIRQLDAPDLSPSLDLHAQPYLPGCVGLNNIGANDYMNVVIQALAHVRPLRNFFLRGGPPGSDGAGKTIAQSPAIQNTSELVRRFAALVRKIWNPRGFKAQVSPHEFLQEVVNASKGRLSITKQGDPVEFLGWLLNRLHTDMGGSRKKRSIISDCFQGEIRIESQKVFVRSGIELDDLDEEAKDKLDSDGRKEGGQEDELGNAKFNIDREVQVTRSPFFLLTIDLPTPPVFQDSIEKNIIPQVPIGQVSPSTTASRSKRPVARSSASSVSSFLPLSYCTLGASQRTTLSRSATRPLSTFRQRTRHG